MEGSGTDYDYRIKRLEDGFEKLSGVATDLHHIVTRLDERTEKHTDAFNEMRENHRSIASQKPTVASILAVVIPSLSVFAGAGLLLIAPVDQRSETNMADIKEIQRTRFTRDDYQRGNDLLRSELESEIADLRHWQQRQDDNIVELLKETAAHQGRISQMNE